MVQAEPSGWRSAAGQSNLKIQGDTRDANDPNHFGDSPQQEKGGIKIDWRARRYGNGHGGFGGGVLEKRCYRNTQLAGTLPDSTVVMALVALGVNTVAIPFLRPLLRTAPVTASVIL